MLTSIFMRIWKFQSTLPHGERLYIIYYSISQQVATLYLRKSFMLLLIFDYVNNKTFIYLIDCIIHIKSCFHSHHFHAPALAAVEMIESDAV